MPPPTPTRSDAASQWKPRTVTFAPDGFGGYVELPKDAGDIDEAETAAPTAQGSLRFFEC